MIKNPCCVKYKLSWPVEWCFAVRLPVLGPEVVADVVLSFCPEEICRLPCSLLAFCSAGRDVPWAWLSAHPFPEKCWKHNIIPCEWRSSEVANNWKKNPHTRIWCQRICLSVRASVANFWLNSYLDSHHLQGGYEICHTNFTSTLLLSRLSSIISWLQVAS